MDRAYHDRKMLKWLPFEALEPQRESLLKLFKGKSETRMPALSDDQLQANQYRMEEALHHQEVVRILYFESGSTHTLYSRIVDTNPLNRKIITEDGPLEVDAIIEIA
ncbi:MAG: YolD-like family protein [Bacillota bacterium]